MIRRMKRITQVNLFMCVLLIAPIIVSIVLLKFGTHYFGIAGYTMANHFFAILVPSILAIEIKGTPINQVLRIRRVSMMTVVLTIMLSLTALPTFYFISAVSASIFPNIVSDMIVSVVTESPFVVSLTTLAIFPAIIEEIAIRGVVLHGCRYFDFKKIILLNGLFFGLFHSNLHQFVYTFVYGMMFCYLVLITGSIIPSMISHFTVNGLQVLLMYAIADVEVAAAQEVPLMSAGQLVLAIGALVVILGISIGLSALCLYALKSVNASYDPKTEFGPTALVSDSEAVPAQKESAFSLSFIPVLLIFFLYVLAIR